MDVKLDVTKMDKQVHSKRRMKALRFFAYIQELKEELGRVSWTTKEELKISTKMVVASTFFLGLGIYGVDLAIKNCLDAVRVVFQAIFG